MTTEQVKKMARSFYYNEIAPRISEPTPTSESAILGQLEVLIQSIHCKGCDSEVA